MNCRELVDFIMDYLDGNLGEAEGAEFARHLGACPDCVHYLDSYRKTVGLGKCVCDTPDGPIPADVPEDLVKAILEARKKGERDA